MSRSLGRLVRDWFDRAGLGKTARAAFVVHGWPDLVGPGVAAHARAERVENGILVVRVESNVWATELSTRVPRLLGRIAEVFGDELVTDVRFVTGLGPASPRVAPGGESPTRWPDREDLVAVDLDDADLVLLARFRAAAVDPALAEASARWLEATLRARRWLNRQPDDGEGE